MCKCVKKSPAQPGRSHVYCTYKASSSASFSPLFRQKNKWQFLKKLLFTLQNLNSLILFSAHLPWVSRTGLVPLPSYLGTLYLLLLFHVVILLTCCNFLFLWFCFSPADRELPSSPGTRASALHPGSCMYDQQPPLGQPVLQWLRKFPTPNLTSHLTCCPEKPCTISSLWRKTIFQGPQEKTECVCVSVCVCVCVCSNGKTLEPLLLAQKFLGF